MALDEPDCGAPSTRRLDGGAGRCGAVIAAVLLAHLGCGCSLNATPDENGQQSIAEGEGQSYAADLPMSPIATENELPGTDDWRVTSPAAGEVEGYASATSAIAGDHVEIFVNTNQPRSVTWTLYRMGYYQRHGAREIATGDAGMVSPQQPCGVDPDTGMVECYWDAAIDLEIDPTWLTGQYLIKLSADGHESYVPLVIRESRPRAPILVQSSVTTWQAYNGWGGSSLYGSKLKASSGFSGDRAYRVSFDRPYACSTNMGDLNAQPCEGVLSGCTARSFVSNSRCVPGAGDFFKGERWMISWLERKGYDVAYVTNLDVDASPDLLSDRRLFMSVGHDEYWSVGERDALEAARDGGVSLAILSGNTGFWRIRFGASASGTPRRTMTCYREANLDPINDAPDTTVQFRSAPFARAEGTLLGVQYEGITEIDGFPQVVSNALHWVYQGTGVRNGDVLANIVGNEWDYVFHDADTPNGIETVAHALAIRRAGRALPAEAAVYYPTPTSLVFAGGTIQWAWALGREGYADLRVERMTENVLTQAGIPAPVSTNVPLAPLEPEQPAWEPRVLAGSGEAGYRDGKARDAMFNAPAAVARGSDGTLYVTDQRNHRIRAISPGGVVSTLAGCGPDNASYGSYQDGLGAQACFNAPGGIAIGQDGLIYVADTGNQVIRSVTTAGQVATVAGMAGVAGNVDAPNPHDARFSEPRALAVGPDGRIYIADSGSESIRMIDARGVGTFVAKIPKASGVTVAADGTVYAASGSKSTIFVIKGGAAQRLAGGDLGDKDGPAQKALLRSDGSMIVEDGRLIFSDSGNYKLRAVNLTSPANVVTLVSGTSSAQRTLHLPRGIARAPEGWIVVDAGNNRIVSVPRDIQPVPPAIVAPGPTAP